MQQTHRYLRLAVLQITTILLICATLTGSEECDPDADPTYLAAVVEYSPTLGVNVDNAHQRFQENVAAFVNYAKEAKRQGAEIVVFPECGLVTLELPRDPGGSPVVSVEVPMVGRNPCIEIDASYPQELRDLSCAARDAAIYMVVNLPEEEQCAPALTFCPECPGFDARAVRSGIVACNVDGRRFFNTDVAFDRKGTVVAKYRKYNLYGEAGFVPPAEPSMEVFVSDFGVRFGLFTCFDLMFEVPAMALVTESEVTDVIFPTAWFSELPFLTAVQAQASWSWVMDVNFLGAGYNLPEVGSTGSGIYAGRLGVVVANMDRERSSKLLVGRLPNRNSCKAQNAEAKGKAPTRKELTGKVVQLPRDEDPPIPKPQWDPETAYEKTYMRCVRCLPRTPVDIPSLYKCHLKTLLSLKENGNMENVQTGEEAGTDDVERYEMSYQRPMQHDADEFRADEEEFREVLAPRDDGYQGFIYGPRFQEYLQNVYMRGLRGIQEKSYKRSGEIDEEVPSIEETAEKLKEKYAEMGEEMEEENVDFIIETEEKKRENARLHAQPTPSLEETQKTLQSSVKELEGDSSAKEQDLISLADEHLHEKKASGDYEESEKEEMLDETDALSKDETEEREVPLEENNKIDEEKEDVSKELENLKDAQDVSGDEGDESQDLEEPLDFGDYEEEIEEETYETDEAEDDEGLLRIDQKSSEMIEVDVIEEPTIKDEVPRETPLHPAQVPVQQSRSSTRFGAQLPESTSGQIKPKIIPPSHGRAGPYRGPLVGEYEGYIYLKTEDLSNYATYLLTGNEDNYENSSLKVCHHSFCCQFQVALRVHSSECERKSPDGNTRSTQYSGMNDEEFTGPEKLTSFVGSRRQRPAGGSFAKQFLVTPTVKMGDDDDDDDENSNNSGDDYDDDDEYENDDDDEEIDPADMEPDENALEDTSEVDAMLSVDTVLLKASGAKLPDRSDYMDGTVKPEDMMPSEETIRMTHEQEQREKEMQEFGMFEDSEEGEKKVASRPPSYEAEKAEAKKTDEMKVVDKRMDENKAEEKKVKLSEKEYLVDNQICGDTDEEVEEGLPPMREPQDTICEPTERYYYRLVAYDGLRSFDGLAEGGLQVCGIIACTDETVNSCGKLHEGSVDLSLSEFRKVRIEGRFRHRRALPLPSTVDGDLMPLDANSFNLSVTPTRRDVADIVMETTEQVNFLTFGIYSRDFENDPKKESSTV